MRILYLALLDLATPTGGTTHVKEVVKWLREFGHQVTLMTMLSNESQRPDGDFIPVGTTVKKTNKIAGFLEMQKGLRRIKRHLKSNHAKYDIVYTRHPSAGAEVAKLCKKHDIPLVYEVNGAVVEERKLAGDSLPNKFYLNRVKKSEKKTVDNASHIITVTENLKEYIHTLYDYPPDKITVVNNGVDPDRFYPMDKDNSQLVTLRRELGISEDDFVIGFVGNLAEWRDIELLVEFFERTISAIDYARGLIIGGGKKERDISEALKKRNLDGKVLLTGYIPHRLINYYINLFDIAIELLKEDADKYCGTPIKVYEYLACGKFVVANKLQMLEFIEDNKLGALIDFDKVEIDRLLAGIKYESVGGRAREYILVNATWELAARKIERILIDS